MDLRKLLKCPVTVALLILWAALSVVGYLGKDTIYKNYTVDIRTTPYFVLVFDGLHDGIFPWSHVGAPGGIGENGKLPSLLLPGESVSDTELAGGTEAVGETETEEAPRTREFCMVDDDWFDDAVFIGDSRTVGLRDYGGLDNATFYASTGLGIYDMWTEKFCDVDGEKTTLEDALSRRQMWNLLRQLNDHNLTILLTTHYMEEAESLCQRVAFMDRGRLEEVSEPKKMVEQLGHFAVDEMTSDGLKSHYFKNREDAIAHLSRLTGQTALRNTTLEDVFVARAEQKERQR